MEGRSVVDQKLANLRNVAKQIFEDKLFKPRFFTLYCDVIYLVDEGYGGRLYNELMEMVTHHVETNVRQCVLSSLQNNFLSTLNQTWNDYQNCIGDLAALYLYMDDVYVPRNNVDQVKNFGLIIFRDQVFHYKGIREHLKNTLIDVVAKDRRGEVTQRQAMKGACNMLLAVGIDSRYVYEEDFERPFLAQSAEFFKAERQRFLLENSASVYVKRAENCINKESERAKFFLDELTEQRIVAVVEEELIQKHLETIVEIENYGVGDMLKSKNTEDLRCMYELLGRVTDGHETLRSCIRTHLHVQGNALVAGDNPLNFIQSLLDLKDFLSDSFNYDPSFDKVTSSVFKSILNSKPKSPEYLSLFIDNRLKLGMAEQDIETLLDKAMVLFGFLHEKDIFECYFKKHLSKRLLNKSVSVDSEKYIVSKLKSQDQGGYQFISNLEGMLKDMSISNIYNEEFKNHIKTTGTRASLGGLDLNVCLLSTKFWPTKGAATCVLPLDARSAIDIFRQFYLSNRSGRLLTLQPNLGNADLSAVFYGPRRNDLEGKEKAEGENSSSALAESAIAPRKHIIQVSTYQMCILMLFNSRDRLTYEDITNATNMEKKELDRALQSLTLGKTSQRILLKTPKGKDIIPSSVFCVNDSFTSKLHRIKIQTVAAGKSEHENKEIREKVNVNRKYDIEATIVRIMKFRKSMQHHVLLAEVTEQLKKCFLPTSTFIKERIDSLIEREYLARDPGNREVYLYVT